MTALPSFVELMASLGLDHGAAKPDQSTRSSPTHSPRLGKPQHIRSKSTQCFREMSIARHVRYSPYFPGLSAARRGSLSSSSSSPELDLLTLRASSTSPLPTSSPRLSRRSYEKPLIDVYSSVSDLSANTPISSYVRRKTPGPSPTSPTFPRESLYDSDSGSRDTVTVPTLPTLIHSPPSSSDSFHTTFCDSELPPPEVDRGSASPERSPRGPWSSTGVQISTPPRSAAFGTHHVRSRSLVHNL